VCCFKPFKQAFRAYRDKWSLSHKGHVPIKEDLAQWISFALKRALSTQNIKKAFQCTGVYRLNAKAVDHKLSPSEVYEVPADGYEQGEASTADRREQQTLQDWEIEEIFNEDVGDLPTCEQYYIDIEGDEGASADVEAASPLEVGT